MNVLRMTGIVQTRSREMVEAIPIIPTYNQIILQPDTKASSNRYSVQAGSIITRRPGERNKHKSGMASHSACISGLVAPGELPPPKKDLLLWTAKKARSMPEVEQDSDQQVHWVAWLGPRKTKQGSHKAGNIIRISFLLNHKHWPASHRHPGNSTMQ